MRRLMEMAGTLKRALGALRFRKGRAYNARAFWESRHARYGSDFRAVANVSGRVEERYEKQREQFLGFLHKMNIVLSGASCIEVGCGNGFWANVALEAGARWYRGLDISRTAVENCRKAVPDAAFECVDLSEEGYRPEEAADLVFSIDVIQHVVEEGRLKTFLSNMVACTRPGGKIAITSYTGFGDEYTDPDDKKVLARFIRLPKLRWVHAWDTPTLERYLTGCELIGAAEFWDKTILAYVRQ